MLKENLVMLRKLHGYSQEQVAEKVGISRQAYAKWERGTTIPDVEKCALLAELYETTVDGLVRSSSDDEFGRILPAPKGKNLWGSVTMGDRGQIVIPKGARDKFGLSGGQRLIVLSDETGIALIPAEAFEGSMKKFLELLTDPETARGE